MKNAKAKKGERIDFDTNWKEFLHRFLPAFLRFYYPGLYRQIDWTRTPEFLEQELRLALRKKIGRKKINDLLVKVWLKSGKVEFILIHFEIQSTPETDTSKRVFEYHALISVNLGIEDILSIVMYVGEKIPANHNKYEKRLGGLKLKFEFPTLVLSAEKEARLLKSRNPVAIAVLANIWALKTRKKPTLRANKKLQLLDILAKMKYSKEEFQDLFIFVKDLMPLPDKLESIVMKTANIPIEFKGVPPRRPLKKTKSNQMMVDLFYRMSYGVDPEELRRLARNAQKLEQEFLLHKQQAEQELSLLKRQAEQEAQRAEQEAQRAKQEAQRAEQEVQRAEQEALQNQEKTVRLLFDEFKLPQKKIAEKLGLPLSEVKKILAHPAQNGH